MTKKEFIKKIHEELSTDNLKQAAEVLDVVGNIITDVLRSGDKIVIPSVGKFETRKKPPLVVDILKTGEPVRVQEKIVPIFRCSTHLREALNGK